MHLQTNLLLSLLGNYKSNCPEAENCRKRQIKRKAECNVNIPDVEQETGPQAKEKSHPVSVSLAQAPLGVVGELLQEEEAAAYSSEVEVEVTRQGQDTALVVVAEVVCTD